MQITLYSGFSKEVNSTKQPTGGTAVSCTLKENTSIINPVFILNGANFSTNYVSWNGRYYFVDDIVSVRNGAVEVHCSVDVLATYKTEIGASSQYVTRSASRYNPSIIDNKYPTLPFNTVTRQEFTSMHSQVVNGSTYVLGVLGGGASAVDGVKYYALSASDFATFMDYLATGSFLDAPVSEISKALQKELVNPFQYIASCMWFPFEISSIQTSQALTFGYYTYDSFVVPYINPNDAQETYAYFTANFTIPNHPQAEGNANSYLRCNPYTRLLLHVYGFGDMVLDASLFNSNTAYSGQVKIYVDYFSGVALLLVENDAGIVVYRNHAQFGVPVQMSQMSSPSLIHSALSTLSAVAAAASGNFIGSASGVGDALNALMPSVEKAGAYGTRAQFTEVPSLTVIQAHVTAKDRARHGYPCMEHLQISTLSGYVECDNIDISITGTAAEKDKIIGFMESGFFYE